MSDILRTAMLARLVEFPLAWRKDDPDHWSASAGPDLTISAWPSRGCWQWALTTRDEREVSTGKAESRRTAMDAAEKATKAALPAQTDVQIVTGWLARQANIPDDVLAAALRLAETDKGRRSHEPNAIVGRKPACGHVVAVDVDDTPEHRAELERRGYAIEIHPRSIAVGMIDREHAECIARAAQADSP